MHKIAFSVLCCVLTSCSHVMINSSGESGRVEDELFVQLGGIRQWITIRGTDASNPILLVIHGGPGDVQSPLVETFAPYERDYVVVQWDQRGSGRTFGEYREETPDLTLDQLAEDGIELAEFLHGRFRTPSIVLLGHSLGTVVATGMALRRPDLFTAYVGTGQVTSWVESVNWQFDFLRNRAIESNNEQLRAQLDAIGHPDPSDAAQYFGFARHLRSYFHESDATWLAGLRGLIEETVSASEFETLADGMRFSGKRLIAFSMRTNLTNEALDFDLPYFVIQGRYDISTPTPPAERYFSKVAAPAKEIVIIEDAGHFAFVTHAQDFISALDVVLGDLTD